MGKIAQTLKKEILLQRNKKIVGISEVKEMKEMAKELRPENHLQEFKEKHNTGKIDSLYYPYLYSIRLIAACMYSMMGTKEMEDFKKAAQAQEKLYMPSDSEDGPVTESYYRIWELADFQFGSDRETLCGMFLELSSVLNISTDEIEIASAISNSRMGIYEVCEIKDEKFLLKELVSDESFWCLGLDGIEGKVGQLWYIRVFPSFYYGGHAMTISAPYVLLSGKEEWNSFFKRNGVDKKNLHDFMKFGPSENFWNEFIFFGFACFSENIVFLNGLPDLPHTLPCKEEFNEKEKLYAALKNGLSEKDKGKIVERNMQQPDEADAPKKKRKLRPVGFLKGPQASEVFLEYSMPILKRIAENGATDLKTMKDALMLPWVVWNLSFLKQKEQKYPKELKEYYKEWIKIFEERKRDDFDDYKYLLSDFKIIPKGNGRFHLKMETMELPN